MQQIFFHKNKRIIKIVLSVIIIALAFCAGAWYQYKHRSAIEKIFGISNKDSQVANATNADFEPFWEVWNTLDEKFVGAVDITAQDRVYGAIKGLVDSFGDPYTTYFTPEENKAFTEAIKGEFGGIGMEVGMKDNILTAVSAIKDTPAYKAGIKGGDKILKIDDTITTDLSIDQAITLIRGEKGTTVRLTILHEGGTIPEELKIVRDIIPIPTLDTELRGDGIFVINLYNFSENSATLFRKALQEFSNSGSDKLIVDLRGNPGGYLDAAIDMASWFLPSGDVVVSEDFGTAQEATVHRSKGYDVFTDKLKFVILIDGGSASASEILAGALHDNGRATLVGETSYGKGSVQEVVKITNDTSLKVTIAKWLTPKGISISKEGITPDVKVELTSEDVKAKNDKQLDKAVEILLKK
jgi:carboxyl-terminal processing protease